ncbi:MAG: amino acid permease [Eubacteriales bacterium]|nr:amino acid permease [Eubacteriales bacterium]MDD3198816.1 amino acid permease [Eubacteriales bacterium]MDD4122175.1 amino acid permease [Eubacteriales bacterium]MDD4629767.1 amino acid permease [Eubacteriales bacterium]
MALVKVDERGDGELQRGLKTRHMNMIAIGGAIGTGLFVALGGSMSEAGPGGALLAYGVIGIMVYFLMQSLGEMATYMPISGAFETYATKFVDPALGFALGWNYWYNWAITLAAELVAGAIVIKFWLPDTSAVMWSAIFLSILFGLNYFSVKMYGESEFWFAGIKVVAIIVFLIVGVMMIVGIIGGHNVGFDNWTIENAPFAGGIIAIVNIFMIAGFSFQGTELVGVAAGETDNPERNVPKAIRTVFWRILIFYIGAIIVVGFILPYNDPNLLNTGIENVAVSPFTLIFERAGIAFAASLMNAVILTSVLSCGNSGLYAATRMLYAMSKEGKAPKLFSRVNKRGVPVNALILTTAVGMAAFLTSPGGDSPVYLWLVNASGLAGFIAWLGIAISHYKFRKAFLAQGHSLSELKFKAKLYPFGPIFAMILCLIVIVGQGTFAFSGGNIDWLGVLVAYIGIPLFLLLYFGYKIIKKTKSVKPEEADLSKGFAKID